MSGGPVRNILALNSGSSSLKFGLYECTAGDPKLLGEGEAEEVGRTAATFSFVKSGREKESESVEIANQPAALRRALDALYRNKLPPADAVGHRFVHGGPNLREHKRLTEEIYKELGNATQFAPLHIPPAMRVLDAVRKEMPKVPQVVCLDTAFHRHMPEVARTYALPEEIRSTGVERYGFHGISLESILAQLNPVPRRLVVAHLGNGCSVTAIRDGVSVDTSMGLTPTGGMMMGTRPGDLDPGVMVYLTRGGYGDPEKLENMLNHQCGLRGISGTTSDFRELRRLVGQDERAGLALRMFAYQAKKTIAAMVGALGGVDLLVFTGGIGEHDEPVRSEICKGLDLLRDCKVQVLPAQEDLQIARTTSKLCA